MGANHSCVEVVAKNDLSVYRQKKKNLEPVSYKAETHFLSIESEKIGAYLKVYPKGSSKGSAGYAHKNFFYPVDSKTLEERYEWYFGPLPRSEARELLLSNEVNQYGAFLVRWSDRKNAFILSIKYYSSQKKSDMANFVIKRSGDDNTGMFYVEKDRKYNTLEDFIKGYREKPSKYLKSDLTMNCSIPTPSADLNLLNTLAINQDANVWNIPSKEVKVISQLGSGNFGTVDMAEWHGRIVALKSLKRMEKEKEKRKSPKQLEKEYQKQERLFRKEMDLMKKLNHPYLVKLLGVLQDSKNKFCIVQEFCDNGDLENYLKKYISDRSNMQKLEFNDLMEMSKQIALGMEHLHLKGILHRDLAARNVLLNKFLVAKVADFGLSNETIDAEEYAMDDGDDADEEDKFPLPFKWCAPEVILKTKFSKASDMWSFGITMYEIFSGGKPFAGYNYSKLKEDFTKNKIIPKKPISKLELKEADFDMAWKIMNDCWKDMPRKRPTFTEMVARFENSYYEGMREGYDQE